MNRRTEEQKKRKAEIDRKTKRMSDCKTIQCSNGNGDETESNACAQKMLSQDKKQEKQDQEQQQQEQPKKQYIRQQKHQRQQQSFSPKSCPDNRNDKISNRSKKAEETHERMVRGKKPRDHGPQNAVCHDNDQIKEQNAFLCLMKPMIMDQMKMLIQECVEGQMEQMKSVVSNFVSDQLTLI